MSLKYDAHIFIVFLSFFLWLSFSFFQFTGIPLSSSSFCYFFFIKWKATIYWNSNTAWLIYWLLFFFQRAVFQLYFGRDKSSQLNIWKPYRNKGWMGEPVQQHLMPLKKYEELDRDENIVLSNRNNAPTLFSKSTFCIWIWMQTTLKLSLNLMLKTVYSRMELLLSNMESYFRTMAAKV